MKKLLILVLPFLLLFISGCEKAEFKANGQPDETNAIQKTAKILSLLDNDDGLTALLINTFKAEGIEEFLLTDVLESFSQRSKSVSNYTELLELADENPLITIAYPSFAFRDGITFEEHLNDIDFTVMLFENPEEVETLPAYDSIGNFVEIDADFDESIDYCVVKYDEFLIAADPNTKTSYFGSPIPDALFNNFTPVDVYKNYEVFTAVDLINARNIERGLFFDPNSVPDPDSGPGDPPNGGGDDLLCDRDLYHLKDELHRIKWSDINCLKYYESGFHLPKVEMIVYYAIPNFNSIVPNVRILLKPLRIHWKNMTGIYSDALKLDLLTWTPDMGDRWQAAFIERDYNDEVKSSWDLGFSAKVQTDESDLSAYLKWSIDIMKNDKNMGQSIIEYCDPAIEEGTVYKTLTCDTGNSGFWFKQHLKN